MTYEIEQISTSDLTPYARNARTHSAEQVEQIANSIKEFGFNNPVLIDNDNGIIAGHGRVMAADNLGFKDVPCIRFESMAYSNIRIGVKDCLCTDCGTEFTVRKDTNPVVCRRCTASRGGKSAAGNFRVPRSYCKKCSKPIRATLNYQYCSVECRSEDIRTTRTCKTCLKEFRIYKSWLSGKTNASGNFCSRPCYEKWLCNSERITGRGSQWNKSRKQKLSVHPFCALCATPNKLDVHHIAPFRLSFDNSQDNLIPLCKKHHKKVESLTNNLISVGSSMEDIKLVMGNILYEYTKLSALKIKEIKHAQA